MQCQLMNRSDYLHTLIVMDRREPHIMAVIRDFALRHCHNETHSCSDRLLSYLKEITTIHVAGNV